MAAKKTTKKSTSRKKRAPKVEKAEVPMVVGLIQKLLIGFSFSYILMLLGFYTYVEPKVMSYYMDTNVPLPLSPLPILLVLVATFVVVGFLAFYRNSNGTASELTLERWFMSMFLFFVFAVFGAMLLAVSLFTPALTGLMPIP